MTDYTAEGKRLLSEGKVAALIVAGGQATRLKLKGSKGLYPVSPIKRKTPFQIFAEKTLACSRQVGRDLPLCIMTSPLNAEEIRTYFADHHYFGLPPRNVFFFSQGVFPVKHLDGSAVYVDGKLLQSPDGNGAALRCLKESAVLDQLKSKGVEILTFSLIDNPLLDPFDAQLIGFHSAQGLDAALIAVPRLDGEKTGVVVEAPNGVQVIEYTEINPNASYPLANISAFAFSLDFVERVADVDLPLHEQKKEVGTEPPFFVLKYEKFIFDYLPFAKKSGYLHYPREEVFAPLKNPSGPDSPDTVREALARKDRLTYQKISGLNPPSFLFELDFSFYYPTPELLKKWRGRTLPCEGYIV